MQEATDNILINVCNTQSICFNGKLVRSLTRWISTVVRSVVSIIFIGSYRWCEMFVDSVLLICHFDLCGFRNKYDFIDDVNYTSLIFRLLSKPLLTKWVRMNKMLDFFFCNILLFWFRVKQLNLHLLRWKQTYQKDG